MLKFLKIVSLRMNYTALRKINTFSHVYILI